MTATLSNDVPLVSRLIKLAGTQDRGALAALRTGLGKPPGAAARMLPIVAPFLSSDEGPATRAAFIVASLFAKHPQHAAIGSLGASLWKATKRDGNRDGKHGEEGVERRFAAALDADPADLTRHLDGLVSLCESAGVPLDWHQFYRDVKGLLGQNEDYQVSIRTRWARHFWRGPSESTEPSQAHQQAENQA